MSPLGESQPIHEGGGNDRFKGERTFLPVAGNDDT